MIHISCIIPTLGRKPVLCDTIQMLLAQTCPAHEIIDEEGSAGLNAAIGRMVQDPDYRVKLAISALEIGRRCFAHDAVNNLFENALAAEFSFPAMQQIDSTFTL